MSEFTPAIMLCPGQGAQAVGMGRHWAETIPAAKAVFAEADVVLSDSLGEPLSKLCFDGPADRLNQTDVSQPAIYACSVASFRGLTEQLGAFDIRSTAGLSLGEYTALHLAGVFDFATGLKLVARRGRLMQDAAEQSEGGMVALIGADEQQAVKVCEASLADAAETEVLVCANFNAPGQIVLSGSTATCDRAVDKASDMGLRAAKLTVAGAFHSPLMQPAADGMAEVLAAVVMDAPSIEVWSNVTGQPHDPQDMELLKRRLVQQIVSPVRWAETCTALSEQYPPSGDNPGYHELAPGSVLKGLMKRISREIKVETHDVPPAN